MQTDLQIPPLCVLQRTQIVILKRKFRSGDWSSGSCQLGYDDTTEVLGAANYDVTILKFRELPIVIWWYYCSSMSCQLRYGDTTEVPGAANCDMMIRLKFRELQIVIWWYWSSRSCQLRYGDTTEVPGADNCDMMIRLKFRELPIVIWWYDWSSGNCQLWYSDTTAVPGAANCDMVIRLNFWECQWWYGDTAEFPGAANGDMVTVSWCSMNTDAAGKTRRCNIWNGRPVFFWRLPASSRRKCKSCYTLMAQRVLQFYDCFTNEPGRLR
jgi:hypothetical protein